MATLSTSACTPAHPDVEPTLEGTGSFEFAPPGLEPITVHYATGGGDLSMGRVVVVMHGTNRNAGDYRDTWIPLVEERPWVVVAPEFDREDFPGVSGYNLGGVVDESDDAVPLAESTFAYIEPLVERTRTLSGVRDATFDLFGHSAGAQFVHRYLAFLPQAGVRRAVAANAGWYTEPDPDVEFPYGLRDAPRPVDLRAFLAQDLTVLLGSEDVEGENLRRDDGADRQGSTRIERGRHFHETGSELARRRGIPFRWSVREVPGVAHDHSPMSVEAALTFAR